jgi:hypothetical protein
VARVEVGSPVRLPDLVGVGVLTAAFPPEVVDLTLEQWDARERRSRLLPARLVAYDVMACVLFMDSAYGGCGTGCCRGCRGLGGTGRGGRWGCSPRRLR